MNVCVAGARVEADLGAMDRYLCCSEGSRQRAPRLVLLLTDQLTGGELVLTLPLEAAAELADELAEQVAEAELRHDLALSAASKP